MANNPTKPTTGPSMGPYAFGFDGTDPQALAVNSDGEPQVVVTGTVPLPTGAATEAKQDDAITQETAIKDALVAAGYTGSRLEALVVAFSAAGSMYLLNDAIKTAVESGGDLEAAVQAVVTKLSADPSTGANQGKIPGVVATFAAAATYAGAQITCTETLTASTRYLIRDAYATLTGGTGGNTTTPGFSGTTGFTQDTDAEAWQMSAASVVGADEMQRDVLGMASPTIWTDANGKLYMVGPAPGAADSTLSGRLELDESRTGA